MVLQAKPGLLAAAIAERTKAVVEVAKLKERVRELEEQLAAERARVTALANELTVARCILAGCVPENE